MKRFGSALAWAYWALVFYEAQVFTTSLKGHQLVGLLLAFPAALLTLALAVIAVQVVVRLGSARLWPPLDVPPPPEEGAPASVAWVDPPIPVYPYIAQA